LQVNVLCIAKLAPVTNGVFFCPRTLQCKVRQADKENRERRFSGIAQLAAAE
jgi:hypothetical protein